MAESLFGLTGEDYWTAPWKNAEQLHVKYVRTGKYGLYFDNPPTVDPVVHRSIPALLYYVAEYREAYKVDLLGMTKVVAIRLEDRAFSIADAITPLDKHDPQPKVGKDSSDPTSEKYDLDLEMQLHLLRKPGKYKVVLLLQQQMSNAVETIIQEKKIKHPDPEAQKFIDALPRPSPPPPPPDPPSPDLIWVRREGFAPIKIDGSPEIPAEPGIVLKVDRVVVDKPGAAAILKGSFRLPVLKRDFVPEPPVVKPNEKWLGPDYGEPRPSAILPITLVILGSQTAAETVIRLHIPVYDVLDPKANDGVAAGHFAIDLMRYRDLRGAAQTLSIYAFCGEFSAGPALIATVPEEMLPQPKP